MDAVVWVAAMLEPTVEEIATPKVGLSPADDWRSDIELDGAGNGFGGLNTNPPFVDGSAVDKPMALDETGARVSGGGNIGLNSLLVDDVVAAVTFAVDAMLDTVGGLTTDGWKGLNIVVVG